MNEDGHIIEDGTRFSGSWGETGGSEPYPQLDDFWRIERLKIEDRGELRDAGYQRTVSDKDRWWTIFRYGRHIDDKLTRYTQFGSGFLEHSEGDGVI